MNLTDIQKQKVAEWIQAGLKLSEIQGRIDTELGVRLTYMEVKLLLADLELKPKDQEPPKSLTPLPATPSKGVEGPGSPAGGATAAGGLPGGLDADSPYPEPAIPEGMPGGGSVSVSVDTVTRPGSVVSGKVTFSDQKTADWYLDQYGRLGLAPGEKGYKPSQMDIMAFQTELQNQLARLGY